MMWKFHWKKDAKIKWFKQEKQNWTECFERKTVALFLYFLQFCSIPILFAHFHLWKYFATFYQRLVAFFICVGVELQLSPEQKVCYYYKNNNHRTHTFNKQGHKHTHTHTHNLLLLLHERTNKQRNKQVDKQVARLIKQTTKLEKRTRNSKARRRQYPFTLMQKIFTKKIFTKCVCVCVVKLCPFYY